MSSRDLKAELVTTGIPGPDDILLGGLPRERIYLVQGSPGTGQTTLALQMLSEGERGLYVTLSESREELLAIAASHGRQLDERAIYDLATAETKRRDDDENTLHVPAEVELGECVGADGVRIGPALEDFHGVMTGVPVYEGSARNLIGSDRE